VTWRARLIGATTAVLMGVTTASAQAPRARRHGIEVGVGVRAGGPVSFGTSSADLVTPEGLSLTLFRTENSLGAESGIDTHVAVPLFARVSAEASASWTRPELRTRITADFEGADSVTLTNQLSRFSFEAAALWSSSRTAQRVWFIRGGGGWTRGLTDGNELLSRGTVASIGGGMKYWWRRSARSWSSLGVRLEGRAAGRWHGIVLGAQQFHVAPVVTASLIVGS
jgi:hypothetical protein